MGKACLFDNEQILTFIRNLFRLFTTGSIDQYLHSCLHSAYSPNLEPSTSHKLTFFFINATISVEPKGNLPTMIHVSLHKSYNKKLQVWISILGSIKRIFSRRTGCFIQCMQPGKRTHSHYKKWQIIPKQRWNIVEFKSVS